MMLAHISGKDGNNYCPGNHGLVPEKVVAPAPTSVNINNVSTDSQKLEVTWAWESSVLESMKSEDTSATLEDLALRFAGSWSTKKAWAKELRIELLARDEASEWNPSWGSRPNLVVSVIHNDGIDPFASGIHIQLPTTEELSAAVTNGRKVKLKNGKVHVRVRITSISQFGLLGRSRNSNGIDIPIESSAESAKDAGMTV